MKDYTDLINRAQSDLNDFGKVSPSVAQELVNALIAVTGDKVFACNGGDDDMHVNKVIDWKAGK